MATFNTAFGSLPGYKEMMGTTNSTAGGEEKQPTVYGGQTQTQRKTEQPAQTFAQMQTQGRARPAAPAAPTATAFGQYGGSEQGQQLRSQLQQRLTEFGQAPSRYDTESFKQIRGAQAANLQSEYSAQQKALNEDLARRGLSASSIGGGRMGDLAGQQARALSSLDAQLLQQAADTQAQDRAQFMQSGQGLAELAGSQDLQQFEANRVAQAATFENQLRSAQFGQQQFEQAGQEAFQGAQSEEAASQAARQFDLAALGQTGGLSLDLQRLLGSQEVERAGLTGQLGTQQTLAGQQQAEQTRQFNIQQALQQQLGVGQLGVSQGELAIRQQQANEEARQFGLSLTEQQQARLQQYGISVQELGLETQRVQNQSSQFGQQLSSQNAQNTAQNNLEQARINEAIAARGTGVSESALERQARTALQTAEQTFQRGESALERGLQTSESALERGSRAALQTQQVTEQGRQFNLEQSLRQALGLSELTGSVYTPMTTGTGVGTANVLGTSLASQQQQESKRQFNLEQSLRQALGFTEATGNVYTPTTSGTDVGAYQSYGTTLSQRELDARRELGLSELFGLQYSPGAGQFINQGNLSVGSRQATAQQNIAQNQLFIDLMDRLRALTVR